MKNKIILSVLLVLILSVGLSSMADAAPWRGGYGYCRPAARFCPPVRVYVPPVVVGPYYRPHYYAPYHYRYGYGR